MKRTTRKPVRRRNPSPSHEITPALIARIAEMTNYNDHTGSVLALATALKAREQEKVLRAIEVISSFVQHMPRDLSEIRAKILTDMLARAKRLVTPTVYQRLYGAF